jgi:L-serine dehydratase
MESISIFDIIKVGIGPSSSHTMGPWKAASLFIETLESNFADKNITSVKVILFGSLAKTGKGHGTDIAAMLGLNGEDYKTIDTKKVNSIVASLKETKRITINKKEVRFDPLTDIIFDYDTKTKDLPHPNRISFFAYADDQVLLEKNYHSLGGGFITEEGVHEVHILKPSTYPCHSAQDLLDNSKKLNLTLPQLVKLNEQSWCSEKEVEEKCLYLWKEMQDCIYRGVTTPGELPGGLHVKRRGADLNQKLLKDSGGYSNYEEWLKLVKSTASNFININKWVACFALAVNEENASFGRIITAPTNGAAGVIPAVLMYAYCFLPNITEKEIVDFVLTAGEIGTFYKKKATISAAMGGCQAEIGVSSSMAAAGLTQIMGGTAEQVLQAAEIAMEHHLGLTCDPVAGLVQIPCIERNTMGAMKAITAANLAMESNPRNAKVSLDNVIATMWQTAKDMNEKYKETSEGGLAVNISVNVAEC